jgi:Tol biopolymer transport system component
MLKRLLSTLFLVGALGLAPSVSTAASFDPDLKWRTLETPHFNITFHQGEAALAEEMAVVAEDVWDKMTKEIGTAPKRPTELVLIDPTDLANGYAMTLPVNTIVIFVTSPSEDSTLSHYGNWNDTILTHEFAHILHLDTIEGLPKLLRMAFGRVININRATPGWIVEGFATFQESRHAEGGRGRSNAAHMVKRMAVLEDEFPPLGNMDGFQTAPPGGNLRYLFGQDFIQYVAETTESDAWTRFIHIYGGWIPYWLPTKRAFGRRLVPMYKDWKVHMYERYGAQAEKVKAEGLTEFSFVSDGIANCMGPTWAPSGEKMVFSCAHPVDGSSIQLWTPGEEDETEIEMEGAFAKDFTWRADGKAFFYSGTHTVDRFNLYDDVYFHTLGKKRSSLLTQGKRARQPSLSPDGSELIVVRNKLQQNRLARLQIDQSLETIRAFDNHAQVANPVHSPNGEFLAVSIWEDGKRDLIVLNSDGSHYRRITSDTAHDMDPAWSADGRWLYFSSDRSSIFNIYAVELETEAVYQVTNVLGGAFHPAPSPDGTRLAFESFSHNGMDVVWTPLARDQWKQSDTLVAPDGEGSLQATQSLSETEAPPPESAEPVPAGKPADSTLLPSGIPESTPLLELPGLTGFGGPMMGFDTPPIFGNPFLDAPETGPDVEDGAVNTDDELADEEDFEFSYPVRRYQPHRTLFPPRYLKPGAMLAYGDTLMGFVGTSSWDTLMRWFYSGFLSYRADNHYVGWGASAAYNRWIPVISAGVYSSTVRYGNLYREMPPPPEGGTWVRSISKLDDRYFDKRTRGYLSASFPLKSNTAAYLQWQGVHRTPLTPLSAYESQGVQIYRAGLPTRGFQSSIGGGWGYGKGTSYGRAISTEKGTAYGVSGKLTSALLGSYQLDDLDQRVGFSQFQFGGNYRRYLRVPWFDDHVFAASIAGGGTVGDRTRYGSYRLGGNFGQGGIYSLPEEYRSLRGFRPASSYGDWYYLSSLEYRLPLWWIDRGVGTIPFFAKYISATAYMDAGYAFNDLPDGSDDQDPILASTLVGAGAEIRGRAIIGYGINAAMRLGYGFALRGDGIPFGSIDGLYVRFDTGF